MSIQLHNRIKALEQELIEVKARLELLESPADSAFGESLGVVEAEMRASHEFIKTLEVPKRGPGRPKKVVDASGH